MTRAWLAGPADDALVRALLRDNPMPGWVDLTIEREPSFNAAPEVLGREWAVLGEEAGETIGMYTGALRPVHVNGRAEVAGYLGGLRVAARRRHRIRHVREGFESIRRLAPTGATLPWWFTVIAEENGPARRLLEAGLPGIPRYVPCGEYVTSVIATSRGRSLNLWRSARANESATIAAFHNRHAARYQLSPVLSREVVEHLGIECFLVHEADREIRAVVALWNQQAFKQVVVRGYRQPLAAVRPAYNLYARLFRRCILPKTGAALAQTFLAFLATTESAPLAPLLRDALARCPTAIAVLGLNAAHPFMSELTAFRPLRYKARVYSVAFDGSPALDARTVQPEAALL